MQVLNRYYILITLSAGAVRSGQCLCPHTAPAVIAGIGVYRMWGATATGVKPLLSVPVFIAKKSPETQLDRYNTKINHFSFNNATGIWASYYS
jgi:hypothetical protein